VWIDHETDQEETMEKILLVDDDAVHRVLLKRALKSADFEVFDVGDGANALSLLDRRTVDLVVLDVMMPGMDGWTLMKRIHGREPTLPVVFLTANGSIPSAVEAIREGAADYLTKPLEHVDVLVRAVRRALGTRRERTEMTDLTGNSMVNPHVADHDRNVRNTAVSSMMIDSPLADAERRTIQAALARFNGSRKQTSEFLGMTTRNLLYKLKRYGLGRSCSVCGVQGRASVVGEAVSEKEPA